MCFSIQVYVCTLGKAPCLKFPPLLTLPSKSDCVTNSDGNRIILLFLPLDRVVNSCIAGEERKEILVNRWYCSVAES
jgi:hypothetical protein